MSRTPFPDPIAEGLARGWQVWGHVDAAPLPSELSADVAIVGSGAGGGITAEALAQAGLSVIVIEEGPLVPPSQFRQQEAAAYTQLYQDNAARKTADQAITVLQGRCVGGSTTVNWASSFRTPPETLAFWRTHWGLSELTEAAMAPWFAQIERRLNIHPWQAEPNANNAVLARAGQALGLAVHPIPRNVRGCWDLGSCGMGCPTNAKQSMLVTTLPAALDAGARLLARARAERLLVEGTRVVGVVVRPSHGGSSVSVRARHVVLSGGAIQTPALLLRSQAPDPHGLLGRRTCLHPTLLSSALFDARIEPWRGAPQSLYSDHYLHTGPIDGPLGYKLEAPPLHPLLTAATLPWLGAPLVAQLQQLPHASALLALLRDGFHPDSAGGRVSLHADGSPRLDYPLTPAVLEAAKRALLTMAEWQFAAGARSVAPLHSAAAPYSTWAQARAAIAALPMQPHALRVVSAHVMGGAPMAADPQRGVVDPAGRHWQWQGLSVHDGSLFPTSIGANPQLSVYAQAARLSAGLARELER